MMKDIQSPYIVDLTCGWGTDSFKMAFWGARVMAFEKNPIVYSLCDDALLRYKEKHSIDMTIRLGSSLNDNTLKKSPDIVYCDPMYEPDNKGSAKNQKAIQILMEIGDSNDPVEHFLDFATYLKPKKIIFKRPAKSDYIGNTAPSYNLGNRNSTRYDIYLLSKT